jgi:hypothetical protein
LPAMVLTAVFQVVMMSWSIRSNPVSTLSRYAVL